MSNTKHFKSNKMLKLIEYIFKAVHITLNIYTQWEIITITTAKIK